MFHVTDYTSKNLTKVYNEDELANAVYDSVKYYRERAEELQQRNNELYEDAKKIVDEDLKKENKYLQQKLSMSYGQFASQKEKEAYNNFEFRHMHDRLTFRANSGKCPYIIPTGTGIGTNLKVVCPICGESENITDIEAW